MTVWSTKPEGNGSALEVGSLGPAFEVGPITRTDIVRYAGAGGDFNPLHHDDEYARSKGFPGMFAMGMFQAGLLSRVPTDWFGLRHVRTLSLRFHAQVWPGETLRLGGTVVELFEEDEVSCAKASLEATNTEGERKVTGFVIAEVEATH